MSREWDLIAYGVLRSKNRAVAGFEALPWGNDRPWNTGRPTTKLPNMRTIRHG